MRVIYKQAEQGHIVPSHVLEARGPFQHYEPEIVHEEPVDLFPPGATAQNGMTEVVFYECRACEAVLRESELDAHQCDEGDF